MHHRFSIWRPDGIVESIKVYQSFFLAEVNQIDKRNFDRKLAHIEPCTPAREPFYIEGEIFHSMKLRPTHGFIWEYENMRVSLTNAT